MIIFSETFETDGNATRYVTSTPEFSDGFGDFFTRTDGSTVGSFYEVAGREGGFYFAAQDLDGEGAAPVQSLTFEGIDVSGFTGLTFSGLFAEDDDGANEDWDAGDFVLVEYRLDGGAWTDLLAFESVSGGFNSVPARDTDFDGTGDGQLLTDEFARFDAAIGGVGSLLDLRITFALDSGDEDIAVDDLRIEGEAGSPRVLISEFQPNPTGIDPLNVQVELAGQAGTVFSGWLVSIENDGADGRVDRAAQVSGTFDANGLLVVEVPDLENPSFTYVLTDSFTGSAGETDIDADDDGVADALDAFGTILDAVGIADSEADEATLYAAQLGGTDLAYSGDEPRLVFRDGVTGTFYAVNDPDEGRVVAEDGTAYLAAEFDRDPTAGTDSFGAINPTLVVRPDFAINELRISSSGASDDTSNFVEIAGAANASLDGLTLIVLSGEFSPGSVDFAFDLTGGSTDEDGIFLLSNPGAYETDAGDIQADFDFFGSPQTFFLVEGFSGAVGDDLDADDDGVLDGGALGTIVDGISLIDGDANPDASYAETVVGPDGSFTPAGVARQEDGSFDQLAFSDLGADTAGRPNIGEPGTATTISAVQGAGRTSSVVGQLVTVTGVVVGDYDGQPGSDGDLGGFYIQDPFGDGDVATSDGIFVFTGGAGGDVSLGDTVTVTGTVEEFFGQTQIEAEGFTVDASGFDIGTLIVTVDTGALVAVDNGQGGLVADLEAYEGMLVDFSSDATVVSNFNLDRFGEVEVSIEGRLTQFTQENAPSVEGNQAYEAFVARSTFLVDDGFTAQNRPIQRPDGDFGSDDEFRLGDVSPDLFGVLGYGFGDYRLQPVDLDGNGNAFDDVTFENTNPRPDAPEVGGDFQVASFNVLNFFTTVDEGGARTANGFSPRGADSQAEFERQLDKLVTAILESGADVLGLIEIENDFDGLPNEGADDAISVLVDALNAAVGDDRYAFVDPGRDTVGSDAIANAIVYDRTAVRLAEGTSVAILDDAALRGLDGFADAPATFDGPNTNRAVLAATFESVETGGIFTLAVNHFKSKGGAGQGDDADIGDGQAAFNATRVRAAEALVAWLATNPTGSDDADVMLVGDLNAYAQEDPLAVLAAAGYADLGRAFGGDYSYTFAGQVGTLDYVLASASLLAQVTDAAAWNINADEADALDYNFDFGRDPTLFDGDSAARASDHDPLLVGLSLESEDRLIVGTPGDDTLAGGAGDDTLFGGAGRNVLTGGDGADQFVLMLDGRAAGDSDRITDLDFAEGDTVVLQRGGDAAILAGAADVLALVRALGGDDDFATEAFARDGDLVLSQDGYELILDGYGGLARQGNVDGTGTLFSFRNLNDEAKAFGDDDALAQSAYLHADEIVGLDASALKDADDRVMVIEDFDLAEGDALAFRNARNVNGDGLVENVGDLQALAFAYEGLVDADGDGVRNDVYLSVAPNGRGNATGFDLVLRDIGGVRADLYNGVDLETGERVFGAVLAGTTGDDLMEGGDADELLFGGEGADVLIGGEGADVLYGDMMTAGA